MEQHEIIYDISHEEQNSEMENTSGNFIIKQDLDENMDLGEDVQISFNDFVNFHNEQIKALKEEVGYLSRGFELMYKYRTIFELVLDEYFKDDKYFKYKTILDLLDSDLYAFISEDEEKYQLLLNELNVDVVLNEDNQFEFAELDACDDEVSGHLNDLGPSTIRRLPGQRSAPLPECPACGYKARCRLKLEAHLLEHQDNPLVVCNYENCEVPFDLHDLTQHEKDYHQEISLICEMCNEMFDNKSMLVQHYKLHITKKERLKCNFPGCNYTDIYPGRLDRHKKAEHNIEVTKQFKCDFEGCGRIFKDRPSYYTHSLIHKDRTLVYKHKCNWENCGAVFKRRRNLSLHMLKHDYVKKKFTCVHGECRRSYNREKELMRHIELVHKTHIKTEPTDDYETKVEDSNLDTSNDENDASKRSNEDETQEVDGARKLLLLLNKSSSNEQDLELMQGNINEIYQDSDILGTQCELCQIDFGSADHLLSHLKDRHHQYTIKAFRCNFDSCNFVTRFRSVLGKHKNDVHGGKYKCEVCGKLSKDSGNHNRHRNIHKNILYRCRVPNCEAVYKSPKAYYVHVLTHSNEQPVYACDHPNCKYITYYVNTLNVHKLTHSDVRKFFCPYENCSKGFKRNGDLNKHVIHSHKGIKRPQKKRRGNDTQVLQCSMSECEFSTDDNNQLIKHEEEHLASNNVQDY